MGKKIRGIIITLILSVSVCVSSVYADSVLVATAEGEAAQTETPAEDPNAQADPAAEAPAEDPNAQADPAAEAPAEDPNAQADPAAEASAEDPNAPPEIISTNAIVMDADTRAVLYEKDPDAQGSPASVTKVMTTYMALKYGNLSDVVTMTDTGVALAVNGLSNLYTVVGEEFTLEQLLYGTMLKSANDMATQVGEYVGGGSLDQYLSMANAEAAEMGCENTHFANACGYPDADNYTSARDIALISCNALKIEKFREIISTPTYTIPATNKIADPRIVSSHVKTFMSDDYKVEGCFGGKTGYTDIARNCLVTYAERSGRTIIVVVLHAPSDMDCASDAVKLFNYAYNNYKNMEVEVPDLPGYKCQVTVPNDVGDGELTVSEEPFTNEGAEFMKISFAYDGKTVGSMDITKEEYDLVKEELKAEEEAAKAEEEEEEVHSFELFTKPVDTAKKEFTMPRTIPELLEWAKEGPNLLFTLIMIAAVIGIIAAIIIKIKRAVRRFKRKRRRKLEQKRAKS